jgi:hypothetical protein
VCTKKWIWLNLRYGVNIFLDLDRELFTRHGFHLNTHGKEHAANDIVSVLSSLLKVRKKAPIALKWKDMVVNDS